MMHSTLTPPAAERAARPGRFATLLKTGLFTTTLALLAVPSLLLPEAARAQEVAQASQSATVNINSADAQTLSQSLNGVGLTRAEEIVRYRESYGPFKSIDELVDVKGIGPATLEKNRTLITLE
jgi:competence protein ComEA